MKRRRLLSEFTRAFFAWVTVFVILLMFGVFSIIFPVGDGSTMMRLPLEQGAMNEVANLSAFVAAGIVILAYLVKK